VPESRFSPRVVTVKLPLKNSKLTGWLKNKIWTSPKIKIIERAMNST
jgi:hypothetical protein